MAAAAYTEDLTDITLAENATGWTGINFSGGGGGAPAAGIDLAMQGTNCVDRPVSNAERGIVYDFGATIIGAIATGVHIFQWLFNATPGLCDNIATRGAYIIAGTGVGDLVQFTVEGNDTYGAAPRVGRCYAYRYNSTANASPPYRTLTGTPGGTPQFFGAGLKTTAAAKGSNLGVDAMRYGTGAYITAGELISAGDASDIPATFAGFRAENDAIANRWGILTLVDGTTYELQGRFAIGQNNSKVPTLCRFKDSNKTINILDTVHSEADFTQIIIDHASTRVEWDNISIVALGTTNPGRLVVNNASSTVLVNGGSYSGIGITTLRAGCVMSGVTWRASGQITLNGATLTDCSVINNTAASSVVAATLNNITGGNFASDGSNHAVELTSPGGGSMNWDAETSGYVAGTSGNNVSSSSTGNETIFLNFTSAATFTINVATGASIPSIRKAAGMTGNVNIVAGAVTLQLTVQDTSGTKIENARALVTAGAGGPFPGDVTVTITTSGTTASVAHTAHGLANGDKVLITGANENELVGVQTISNVSTNAYDYTITSIGGASGTGTIKSSFVIISGLTNASGVISDTRTYGSSQPLGADSKVRKSSGSPFYKTGDVVGTVSSSAGASITIVMLADE